MPTACSASFFSSTPCSGPSRCTASGRGHSHPPSACRSHSRQSTSWSTSHSNFERDAATPAVILRLQPPATIPSAKNNSSHAAALTGALLCSPSLPGGITLHQMFEHLLESCAAVHSSARLNACGATPRTERNTSSGTPSGSRKASAWYRVPSAPLLPAVSFRHAPRSELACGAGFRIRCFTVAQTMLATAQQRFAAQRTRGGASPGPALTFRLQQGRMRHARREMQRYN